MVYYIIILVTLLILHQSHIYIIYDTNYSKRLNVAMSHFIKRKGLLSHYSDLLSDYTHLIGGSRRQWLATAI